MVTTSAQASALKLDRPETTSILSLLLSGTLPCGGASFENTQGYVDQQAKDEERRRKQEEAEAEAQDAIAFDKIKGDIREAYEKVQIQMKELKNYGKDKAVRQRAQQLSLTILDDAIGEKYEKAVASLKDKEKFRQSLTEGAELAELLKKAVDELIQQVNKANSDNSLFGRMRIFLNDLVNEDSSDNKKK